MDVDIHGIAPADDRPGGGSGGGYLRRRRKKSRRSEDLAEKDRRQNEVPSDIPPQTDEAPLPPSGPVGAKIDVRA